MTTQGPVSMSFGGWEAELRRRQIGIGVSVRSENPIESTYFKHQLQFVRETAYSVKWEAGLKDFMYFDRWGTLAVRRFLQAWGKCNSDLLYRGFGATNYLIRFFGATVGTLNGKLARRNREGWSVRPGNEQLLFQSWGLRWKVNAQAMQQIARKDYPAIKVEQLTLI